MATTQSVVFGPLDLRLGDLRTLAVAQLDMQDSDNHYGAAWNLWINEGQQRMLGNWGIEDHQTFTTAVGVRTQNLPLGTIKVKQVCYEGYPLERRQLITQDFFDTSTGFPMWYAIWGINPQQILLGPNPPNDTQPLDIWFTRAATIMKDDGDAPDVPPHLRGYLADYASAKASLADGNMAAANAFMESFASGVKLFDEWRNQRSETYLGQLMEVDY